MSTRDTARLAGSAAKRENRAAERAARTMRRAGYAEVDYVFADLDFFRAHEALTTITGRP
jgi:hypothetical protein